MAVEEVTESTWASHRLLILRGLERIEKELSNINTKIDQQDDTRGREIADLRVKIAMLEVRMGIMSVVASVVTSAIVGTIVSIVMRGH